jgi:hypothetical protein
MPQRSAQPLGGEQGSAADKPPFKQIECANIRRLCLELSPAALKVWMFHLGLTNLGDSSYAKVNTIAAGTGLHSYTVKIARGWLRANGWLELVRYRKFASASLPELRCVLPGPRVQKTPSLSSGRVQKTPGVGSRRLKKTPWARVQKTPTEVDLSLEVDITPEVQLSFRTMETAVLPIDAAGAEALWKEILGSAQQLINPHSFSTWFQPTRGESIEAGRLRVRVPTRLFSRRLSETYGACLRETLARVGRPDLALEFVHGEGARQ